MTSFLDQQSPGRVDVQLEVALGDITTWRVDAIVNAANNALAGGGGVDGAIHAAGGAEISEACRELRRTTLPDGLPTGQAVATRAGRLPCEWLIHTVGPVYSYADDRSALLRSCYHTSLAVADEVGARTVAFPLISAGVFGWPKDDAIHQAVSALHATDSNAVHVTLVLFDEVTYCPAPKIRVVSVRLGYGTDWETESVAGVDFRGV